MQLTPEETEKVKVMLSYLIDKKHDQTGGHSGFHPREFEPVLQEMVNDGAIEQRETINSKMYFKSKS